MKALCFDGALSLRDVPSPTAGEDEAIVAVRYAGICATDLEVLRGYRSHEGVLGHEMVGTVVACAAAPGWEGKRVAAEITVACGACPTCRRGHPGHCERRSVMGIFGRAGCMAERVAVPIRNLHAIPDTVDDRAAAFVEPLAAAYEIASQVDVAGQRVAVLGDGKLGLLVAMALHRSDAQVTLLGRHDHKLAIAAAAGIAIARGEDTTSFPIVVEATGSPSGLADALARTRPRGTLVLKSTFKETPALDTNRIVVDEITVLGSRCGPFETAIDAMARGAVDPRPLVEATYPLGDAVAAFEHAARRGALKILVEAG